MAAAKEGAGPLIFIIAGEPSGDALGAKLMHALREATGGAVRFAGVGGDRMAAEGLRSLFPLHDIAVMGITEILPQVPTIFRRINETVAAIRQQKPAVLVTIDAPAFVLRVIRKTRSSDLPVVHYVAPQLWAWRPWRVKKLVGRIDRLLLLLPFEQEFFDRAGVPSVYVGHPVLEEAVAPRQDGFRTRHGIARDTPLLVVLPGSRRGLVRRMLPVYGEAMRALHARHPGLRVVVPVVSGTAVLVEAAVRDWPAAPIIVTEPAEKRAARAGAGAPRTTSGPPPRAQRAVAIVARGGGRRADDVRHRDARTRRGRTANGGYLQGQRPKCLVRAAAHPGAECGDAESDRGAHDPARAAAGELHVGDHRRRAGRAHPQP